jgi:hypothetical protein
MARTRCRLMFAFHAICAGLPDKGGSCKHGWRSYGREMIEPRQIFCLLGMQHHQLLILFARPL